MIIDVNFQDLSTGDKVRIVDRWQSTYDGNERWNHDGYMDHHLGTVMTIRAIDYDRAKMVEDNGEHRGSGWVWYPEMIAGLWVEEDLDEDTSEWIQETLCSLFE